MSANEVLDSCFRNLPTGSIDAALENLTEDTVYSHGAYEPGTRVRPPPASTRMARPSQETRGSYVVSGTGSTG